MNTLNIIKKQIEKASALHNAQITMTTYRGIETKITKVKPSEIHGKFTYRGHTYTKWLTYKLIIDRMGGRPPIFLWIKRDLNWL